ncbi:unnamed protein product [Spirodela intermedia]|uniref:Uncharacterized protein n=2 Tax=Spirodela intermedia TaxID=51605 RepID=A0A7I8JK48_SPIIN|nr:unnamed protein product [Spirodela intermedia]CAA6670557.1 unnamed protein product [Spirodela intermedia]CAA7407627.1 unnamed protein product [Spirodela intermedia]
MYQNIFGVREGPHFFIKHSFSGRVTILIVYVDGILVIGNDDTEKKLLSQCLSKEMLSLSQQKYVIDLLQDIGKTTCKPVNSLVNLNLKLSATTEEDIVVDKRMYQQLVDRWSTAGYCTFLEGNLIIWKSKKKNVIAQSSVEAEFRVMTQDICEILWVNIILKDLKIKIQCPMKIYCDNKSMISIT